MDPIALLERLREVARALIATVDGADPLGMSDEDRRANEDRGEEIAQLFVDLDEWRRKGGFDPWSREQTLDAISERERRRERGLFESTE